MICIQKYTSLGLHNLKICCEEAKNVWGNYFIIIHTLRTKGYVQKSLRPGSLNCSIVRFFEVSCQNISPFSSRIKPKLFETLSDATESNAQRDKLSLQATISSGISHFRKTHLKRCEVIKLVLSELRRAELVQQNVLWHNYLYIFV